MEVLRETKTWDSNSKSLVRAKVVECEGKIFIISETMNKKTVLEKDAVLYKILSPQKRLHLDGKIFHLVLEPSMKCNLECPICFTNGQESEYNLADIETALSNYRGYIVSISGGEPTLHKDICKIIEIVSKNNLPLLATNGLRLTDYSFVKELEDAGLRHITFSFNGFDETTDKIINGKTVVSDRLKAIDNLLRTKIQFLLSMLLIKNVNDGQIKPIVNLAIENRHKIKEVRIRSLAKVGRYLNYPQLYISEMLDLVCKKLEIEKRYVLQELNFKNYLMKMFPWLKFQQRVCSLSFYLKITNNNKYIPLGYYLNNDLFRNIYFIGQIFPRFNFLSSILRPPRISSIWFHDANWLKISLRAWPNFENVEFYDHVKNCSTRYIIGPKKELGVCYANIINSYKCERRV